MLRFEMSVEDNVAEGKRLVEGVGGSTWKKQHYVRGWCRWGRFCAASGVDPLDASWEDVVDCLDVEEMKETADCGASLRGQVGVPGTGNRVAGG